MILQELHRLAHAQNLVGDPDFEPKDVPWILTVNDAGELVGKPASTHWTPHTEGKKKPKPQAKTFQVPVQPGRSGTKAPPYFLVDKAKYSLGVSTPDKDETADELAEKSGWFRELVAMCAADTRDPGACAVAKFLDNLAAGRVTLDLAEWKSNDLCAFRYSKDIEELVHLRPAVRAWWSERRRGAGSKAASKGVRRGDETRRCLLTGKPIGQSTLVPQVQYPGFGSGIALISFNSPAFESYGWTKSDNCLLDRNAAEAAITGLRRLLHKAYPDPNSPGQRLPTWNFYLGSSTTVVYWSDRTEIADIFDDIMEAKPEQVGGALQSVWKGLTPTLLASESEQFHALTLTGAQGRVIVRGFIQQSVPHTLESIARHFADLSIVRNCRFPSGNSPPGIPLRALMEAVAGPVPAGKKRDAVSAALAQRMFEAAVDDRRMYPAAALVRAVERWRAEIHRDEWADANLRDARAAIVKACLLRRRRLMNDTSIPEIKHDMDPTITTPAYRLGCLMAVLEALQQAALGDVNASLVDKFFGAACASPGLVFPRMIKTARSHAKKARREKGGWAYRLENLLDEIVDGTDAGGGYPRALDLEGQGLFGIGYHQMRHWLRMNKEERDAWEAAHPDAPRAFIWAKSEEPAPAAV